MQLNDQSLLRKKAYINGEWVSTKSTFEVKNPFDDKVLAEVADCGKGETKLAIKKAKEAFPAWRDKTAYDRSKLLRKWFQLIHENLDDLATILTSEQGKPHAEAKREIEYGASFIEWFAEEARRSYGDVIPPHAANLRVIAVKQAIGVVGAITPWNFPNAMITRKVAPALAAGCTVVIKPASATPLSALALAVLAERAGFPEGVLNIITSKKAKEVGTELTSNPTVKKFTFTGSTKIGKLLMEQCASTVKKVSLELGGNAPFIVFDDADIDAAVAGAMVAKYRNAGQTCIGANRFYVQAGVFGEFVEKFTAASKKLSVGNGLEDDVDLGPLIDKDGLDKVKELVADALAKGAKIETGGKAIKGNLYEPTVLTNVDDTMDLRREEIFGPVAPIYKFDTEETVIKMANETPYGLASYFYGRDAARIWRVAEALEYGMVGINTGAISTTVAPFGGIKESGIGREGAKYGMDEFMEVKYMCWG